MDEIIIKCTPTQANMILESLAYGDQCPYYGECGKYTECYKCLKERIKFVYNGGDD